MENFNLLKNINMLAEASQKVFTQDDVKFLKLVRDDKAEINDSPELVEKLTNFYADEIPYGVQTGDDDTIDNWLFDHYGSFQKSFSIEERGHIIQSELHFHPGITACCLRN